MKSVSLKKTLKEYKLRRNFAKSPEPAGDGSKSQVCGRKLKGDGSKTGKKPIFVIQKHQASHLHYDFRLEIDGVLKSWAVPKGPSTDPRDKRLAVVTDDHPMEYAKFEGVIPPGNYGAGTVTIWDKGIYKNIKQKNGEFIPIDQCYKNGQIEVFLYGKKLKGAYALIEFKGRENQWLLIKMNDEFASRE